MMSVADLPAVNAVLNTTSGILLVLARRAIARKNRPLHRRLMLSACGVSVLFLSSYLIYHYVHGSTPFQGQGWIRPVYFTILLTHTVLAAAIVPLVLITVTRGLREDFTRHARIARWTFPLWLYVSVTGVFIYLMLYQMFG